MNILIFGPNGSGKGTQGAIVQKRYGVPHIETGVIFRQNISQKTPLGEKAKAYIDRGELVPDNITIPMILARLKEEDCKKGWLLDGFPRNLVQAEALYAALDKENIKLDYVIEIELERDIAKKRIMGRRLCKIDNNHPNNIYIEAIKPVEKNGKMICRVCGCEELTTRADDQDAAAIDKRHNIYYDTKTGTLAAVNFFKQKTKVVSVDGSTGVKEVSAALLEKLA
ncbi:MAG TPA: adenylate kinase [Smithellaceae bacterium]|nr:adenylate kinase [Smithellaceae bacterium]